jgi:hypothetical protein
MLVEGLFTLLNSYAPLTAIVSTCVTQVVLPLNYTTPALTYSVVSTNQEAISNMGTFQTRQAVEINIWSTVYHDIAYGKAALHALLDTYHGTLPDGTVVLYTDAKDIPEMFEEDSRLYRGGITFTFLHR